ncbi:hypothetical protein [Synechococcus sp. MIT S9509]|nr:hypothetical protein [Synechococcus sp. MIT S9509]
MRILVQATAEPDPATDVRLRGGFLRRHFGLPVGTDANRLPGRWHHLD